MAYSDGFNVGDFTDKFEVHISPRNETLMTLILLYNIRQIALTPSSTP